ncbi:hypothetical protein ACJQWK_02112 [Exserohilum turcicum]|uniref:pectate lyase n=1 Tax=Exserohilum turcicum (strain 28A) TaxID=671987 RepID=R0KH87_EXST2|nr:polysaccharide lyase family 1 protein [Exserohilum turcica Et28A]EOA88599.1 polysaccharide lyase family 1 protein [Exserohilum turcica Et28A]
MRFSLCSLGLMAVSALAAPKPWLNLRGTSGVANGSASLEDVATTGFATTNGGTSGGKGGKKIEVSTLDALKKAVTGNDPAIVLITGPITGSKDNIKIGSNKSVIGKDSSVVLTDFTLTVKESKNVIIRNVIIKKVVGGDAVAIQKAKNVWIDHVDVSSDRTHGKDYYDGLIDITHGVDFVTVSNSYLHDHWKCSLVGHSNKNAAEDKGHLTVTYNNNYWSRIHSRAPSIRFGTGHMYNNYYEDVVDSINTRKGAQVLVQNNVWVNATRALFTVNDGYAVASGNDYGGAKANAPKGTFTKPPYDVPQLLAASDVKAAVVGTAGATLKF